MEADASSNSLPLAGLRVLELGHIVAGPTASLILADLGADVIKIEHPDGGDQARRMPGAGSGFFFFNRNKRSVALDLKSPKGKAVFLRLLRSSDICLDNYAPGALDRLGLGFAVLEAENPRLIYMAIKGFLPGPYEHRPSLDELAQMMGGLAFMTGPPGRPLRAGASIIDIGAATYGVIGILADLRPLRDDRVLGRPVDGARGSDRPTIPPHGRDRPIGPHGLGHLPFVHHVRRRAGLHRRDLQRALGAVLRGVRRAAPLRRRASRHQH
jgi:crotonobetainyl-CoA:carnitine CoA-transferase CaiB-like acyl-CoA transferase